jgi:hypothetical protein
MIFIQMKKLLLILLSCFVIGCNQPPNKATNTEVKTTPLHDFVLEFKVKHPDWQLNSVITERTNVEFADSLKKFIKTGVFLDGYPLMLESVNEYKKGKYAVKLVTDYSEKIGVEVIGLIPDSLINHLQEKNEYYIEGKFIKSLTDLKPYYDYGLWNVSPGILFSDDTEPKVHTGVNLFEITKIY